MEIPGRMQVTLVSHYGKKDGELRKLIRTLQDSIARRLLSAFHAYEIDQVHGTLVGLEGCRDWHVHQTRIRNFNFRNIREEDRHVDCAELLAFLQSDCIPTITVRIGGYAQNSRYGFRGRDADAYERSFGVYGQIVVAMGWPVDAQSNGYPLNQLRIAFNELNVLHKEHKPETENHDDAFYFVLGRIDRTMVTPDEIDNLRSTLREDMSKMPPFNFEISKGTLRIAGYLDTQLPLNTSCAFKLEELSPERMSALYPDCP